MAGEDGRHGGIGRGAARGLFHLLLGAALLLAPASGAVAAGPALTPEQVASMLAEMHPDYTRYIGTVRYGSSRLRPASHYAGLVRRGGLDPSDPDDGPRTGRGATNDLIVYADTFESWRTPSWRRLLADHEYFHARHLARGYRIPVVGFDNRRADRDYYEALAWGYAVARARQGAYGDLSSRELAEATARYDEHLEGFRRFVMERQPSAWSHYGRFLEGPCLDLRWAAADPKSGNAPEADRATD